MTSYYLSEEAGRARVIRLIDRIEAERRLEGPAPATPDSDYWKLPWRLQLEVTRRLLNDAL